MASTSTSPSPTHRVTPFAITTTFTAPTQCAQSVGGLTILENDQFRIWLNHPLPVPGTTIASCYPDRFISSFLLQTGGVSQAAFSPLVCPAGYTTQGPYTSNYIACCPSGWDGFAPASNPPSDRPAFGGVCYTNIYNVPIRITSYDSESIKASSIFRAPGSMDQAFAFAYEGYALGVAVVASTTPTGSKATSTNSFTSPQGDNARPVNNSGNVTGAVIGSVLATLLFTGLIALMLNYRRKRMSYQSRVSDDSPTPIIYLSQPPPVISELKATDYSEKYYELEVQKHGVYELNGAQLPMPKSKSLPGLPPLDKETL